MPFVSGFLRIRGGGHADNELPEGEEGVDPGYGIEAGGGTINNDLPRPPPGVFPPPVAAHPIVPAPPGTPPGTIWPPVNPDRPNQGLPGSSGGRPDNSLPGSQPGVDNTLPGGGGGRPDNALPGSTTYWVVVWIPGYGYKYVTVDPTLQINAGPAQRPPVASNQPVETPQPKGDQQPKKPI